jgi:hypothetical protein
VTTFESSTADPVAVSAKSCAEVQPTTPGLSHADEDVFSSSSSACTSPLPALALTQAGVAAAAAAAAASDATATTFRLRVEEPAATAAAAAAGRAETLTGHKRRQPMTATTTTTTTTTTAYVDAATDPFRAQQLQQQNTKIAEKKEAVVKVVRDHIRNLLQTSNTGIVKVQFQLRQHEGGLRRLVLQGVCVRACVWVRG